MNRVDQYLADRLQEREIAGNLRRLNAHKLPVDFFSNDYLGLATTGILTALMNTSGADVYTTGSTGSRLLSGNSERTEILEKTIADFHHAEAALLFNSGYDANIGLLACIVSRNTIILSDALCHASIIDGIRLGQCLHKFKFLHNDLADLESKLKKYKSDGPVIVVVESVYSMDGDMAPLAEMVSLCEAYDARLIVDEAHATGVFGAHGEGLVCLLGLQHKVFARVHTFGKALGCHGAAVVGSNMLKQYLVNFARSFIYTTALPAHSVHAVQCAYEYLAGHNFSNKPLHDLIAYFISRIKETGSTGWNTSQSPIQALIIGDNEKSKITAARLQQAGMQVNPILHPTVPKGMERIRVCLHTFNIKEQVDLLFETLDR